MRAHRTIEHTELVGRGFEDVCLILEREPSRLLEHASRVGSRHAATVARRADGPRLGHGELAGAPELADATIRFHSLIRTDDRAWLDLSWDAHPDNRQLAEIDARLGIRPVVRKGPAASTELTLRAWCGRSVTTVRRSHETTLFARLVTRSALRRMLRDLVGSLEDYEEAVVA